MERTEDRSELLRDCYRNSLRIAAEIGATSVAIPLILAGVYGWPQDDTVRHALDVLRTVDCNVNDARHVFFGEQTYQLAVRVHRA